MQNNIFDNIQSDCFTMFTCMILDWNICDIKRPSVLIDDAGPYLFGVSLLLLCWTVRIHGLDLPETVSKRNAGV